jgi:hypothetical protein
MYVNAIFSASKAAQWAPEPPDNAVLYACAQGMLSLPWNILLAAGDVINNIEWFFTGRSEEMIAMEAHGNFLTMPSFSGRVTKTANAGIDVTHVQVTLLTARTAILTF